MLLKSRNMISKKVEKGLASIAKIKFGFDDFVPTGDDFVPTGSFF